LLKLLVNGAFKLNGKTVLSEMKVQNVPTHGMLASKLGAPEPAISKLTPE
jgi:hypothetical protein